jgi:hypothetical protein
MPVATTTFVIPTGMIRLNGHETSPRDGIAIMPETRVVIEAVDDAEVVMSTLVGHRLRQNQWKRRL